MLERSYPTSSEAPAERPDAWRILARERVLRVSTLHRSQFVSDPIPCDAAHKYLARERVRSTRCDARDSSYTFRMYHRSSGALSNGTNRSPKSVPLDPREHLHPSASVRPTPCDIAPLERFATERSPTFHERQPRRVRRDGYVQIDRIRSHGTKRTPGRSDFCNGESAMIHPRNSSARLMAVQARDPMRSMTTPLELGDHTRRLVPMTLRTLSGGFNEHRRGLLSLYRGPTTAHQKRGHDHRSSHHNGNKYRFIRHGYRQIRPPPNLIQDLFTKCAVADPRHIEPT